MHKISSAAIVWLRYRAQYHSSPLADFTSMRGVDFGILARIYHAMLIAVDKPDVEEIQKQIESGELLVEAIAACEQLISGEEFAGAARQDSAASKTESLPAYDEYDFLARFTMAQLPDCLLYELPIFAIEKAISVYYGVQEKIHSKAASGSVTYKKIEDPREVMRILGGMG